jgi:hypothetical protein
MSEQSAGSILAFGVGIQDGEEANSKRARKSRKKPAGAGGRGQAPKGASASAAGATVFVSAASLLK